MNQKGFISIAIIIIVIAIVGISGYFILTRIQQPVVSTPKLQENNRPILQKEEKDNQNVASIKSEDILESLSKNIKNGKSFKFKRLAGHTEGFIRGEGEVLLPDKLRERKQGSTYDIYWINQLDKQTKFKNANFSDSKLWHYLGGFSGYEAYEEVRYLKNSDFETIQMGNEWFAKIFSSPDLDRLPPDSKAKLQEWRKGTVAELDDESVEIIYSSLLLHIPEILDSAIQSSLQRKTIGEDAEINYFADTKKLKEAGAFNVSLTAGKTYLKDPGYQQTKFKVTVTLSPQTIFKKMLIEVSRDGVDKDSRTNEAYEITFISFGDSTDIKAPL